MGTEVLVTGATGQVGSAVTRALLEAGYGVRALVLPGEPLGGIQGLGLPTFTGDVTLPESLPPALEGVDCVVHLAGIVSYLRTPAARARLHRVFVDGTRNLLDAAATAGVKRFLLTSSIAALGWLPEDQVGDESTPWNWGPLDIPYFAAKKGAEDLVLSETRMEALAVNPGIILGANDFQHNGARLLLQVASGAMPGAPPGATTLANLGDVARGHVAALDRGRAGNRYILGGTAISFLEMYRRIGQVVGREPPDRVLSPLVVRSAGTLQEALGQLRGREPAVTRALAEISIRNRRFRSDKATGELGYFPGPIETGIGECWRWLRDKGQPPSTPR